MTTKSKQLVRAGHELASELKADCGAVDVRSVANLLTELASALDVQSARSDALAAENAALKSAFNPEVIPEEAVEAFAETAIMDHDWNETAEWSWVENDTDVIRAVLEAIKPNTPATDAWVNEQRAVGVDSAIESAKKEIASEFQYQSFDNCISACARHPQSDLSGKVEMVAWLEWFAAQLRGSQV